MRKKLLSMLLALCMVLTLLPAAALATGSTLEVGGSGSYALTEAGLNAAIAATSDGDTIKFLASGTITQAANININKSITLDLNGQTVGLNSPSTFKFLSIPNGFSVTVKGSGTITTNTYIYINNTATLTVQGGAVIEGTGTWQPMMNYGNVSMTGGALRQTNGNFVLQNSGAATFDNVTIETSHGDGSVIWAAGDGTVTLNNCTIRNNFSGTMSGTLPSIILVSNSAAVTINGGSVIAPAGSTLPAIEAASGTTFTNNGATITNGFVRKLGDLTVSVSTGTDKVTLASQAPEAGVTYYYKTTATDDTANKPATYGSADFAPAGWIAFSAATDIPTTGTDIVYVQVVKVGDSEQKIYGWGQGSATPTAAPSYDITASAATNGSYTVKVDGSAVTAAKAGKTVTITPTAASGYTLDAISVCKTDDSITMVTVTGNTFTMPAYAVTVSVTFKTVSPPHSSGGGGGSYTPPTVTEIKNGGSTTGSNLSQLVSGGKTLTVDGDNGAKLVFDTEALKGIGGQTSGDVKVEMKDVSPTHQENLPGKQVFSLTVSSGSRNITNFGGAVTVSLPYELQEGESADKVTVWHLASDGTMTEIPCTYDPVTKLATFKVTHFSLYVVGVEAPWVNPFTDVRDCDWFYGAVEFVSRGGIMKGIGGTAFSPNTTITRGMLVTILWRLEKEPAAAKTISFADVPDGNWYAKAVAWAAANNIVTGYAGKFDPDDALTREQLAAILYRYAAYKNYDVSTADSLSAYADKPSDWALSSVSWAVAKGLIKGSGSSLDPKGSATRAQAAAILQRFVDERGLLIL